MKINLSRQSIYLIILSTILLIFVLLFSFLVLIPAGKEYRVQRGELKKEHREVRRYQDFHDETSEALQKLKADNRRAIEAFDSVFNPQRFEKQYGAHFKSLSLNKKVYAGEDNNFSVYEVNTTSNINSPTSFYDFLDAINKSDWIIGISFPIDFVREEEVIKSSFTMKVYSNIKDDLNVTKQAF